MSTVGLEWGPLQCDDTYSHILTTGRQWICELNVAAVVKTLLTSTGR